MIIPSLQNHPFPVEAFFDRSTVLTYAAPAVQLQKLVPPCLEIDTFNNTYGFIALAMVQTRNLRPKGFPEWMGRDFFLTGYRIFVRYRTSYEKNLRGLYILKSETNKKTMAFFGNLFTHYNYSTTDIDIQMDQEMLKIVSLQSGINVLIKPHKLNPPLPPESPFTTWKEARRFAGPLPFTFTYHDKKREVLIIEGVRENWEPQPLEVINHSSDFIQSLGISDLKLASAFGVSQIPYHWKKGYIDKWIIK